MSVWTVGIDPGKTGAIAVIDNTGTDVWQIHDMPYEGGEVVGIWLAEMLNNLIDPREDPHTQVTAWIEKVAAYPGQGVSSVFQFGQGYGTILGVCATLGVRTHRVTPAVWKRSMGVTKDKGTSRRLAAELWPAWSDHYRRVKDDGRAEACLIAEYGRRQELRT